MANDLRPHFEARKRKEQTTLWPTKINVSQLLYIKKTKKNLKMMFSHVDFVVDTVTGFA